MPAKNIIKTYRLEDRIRVLKMQGLSDDKIADRLNKEDLVGKDSISQPTVSRFVKKDRKLRAAASKNLIDTYMAESLPKDLEIIDEIVAFHYNIMHAKMSLKNAKTGNIVEASDFDLNDRRIAARDLNTVLKTKFDLLGANPETGDDLGESGLDLEKYRTEIRKDEGEKLKPERNKDNE
jgi:hypothetical protein